MPGHFPNLLRTTFDFALYDEVTKQRARRTAGYFALLVVVLSIVLTAATVFHMRAFIKKEITPELDKLPVVTIRNGVASTNVPQPWVRDFDDGNGVRTIFAIDTTGKMTGFAPGEQGILLMRTQVLVKSMSNPQEQAVDWKDVFDEDTTIDAKWMKRWIDKAVWIAAAALLVVRPVYHTGAKLLVALLTSLVALIVASSRRRQLRYGQLFSIALYALTPAILIDTVLDVVNVDVPHFWVLYLLVAAAYAGLAVYKLPEEAAPMPKQAGWPPTGV